jgi:hypothetical protein
MGRATKGVGGDCGTTQKICAAAKCPCTYQTAYDFPTCALRSGVFCELGAGEQKQEGDILSWPNYIAIYWSFAGGLKNATTERTNKYGQKWTQRSNMCTASNNDGPPYSPVGMRYLRRDAPRLFGI